MSMSYEEAMRELMKSTPLSEAYGLCLLREDSNKVSEIVRAELVQLEVWLNEERDYGVMGSTLFSEKTSLILDIADAAARSGDYILSSGIFTMLFRFSARALLSTNKADYEVENLVNDMGESIGEWSVDTIPGDQMEETLAMLEGNLKSYEVVDSGLDSAVNACLRHLRSEG
ncbi:MAG: hypothetical protein ACK5W1_05135 [Flavobacteriales bacterium]